MIFSNRVSHLYLFTNWSYGVACWALPGLELARQVRPVGPPHRLQTDRQTEGATAAVS